MFMFFFMTTDEVHECIVVCLYYLVESRTKIRLNRSINKVKYHHIYICCTLSQYKFLEVNDILSYVYFIRLISNFPSTRNLFVSIFLFMTSDHVLDYVMGGKLSFATTCFDFPKHVKNIGIAESGYAETILKFARKTKHI